MARKCEICGKGPATGNKVRTVTESGRTMRLNVCTRCIRSGAVVKPA